MLSMIARFTLLASLLLFVQGPTVQGLALRSRDGCDAECAVYTQAAICGTLDCICHENIAQGLQSCMNCQATPDNPITTQRIIESYNLSCKGKNDVQSVTVPAVPTTTTDAAGASKTASVISSIASQVISAVTSALEASSTSTVTNSTSTASTSATTSASLNQTASSDSSGTAAPTQTGAKSDGAKTFDGQTVLVGWTVAMIMGTVLVV